MSPVQITIRSEAPAQQVGEWLVQQKTAPATHVRVWTRDHISRRQGGGPDRPLTLATPACETPHPFQQRQSHTGQGAVLEAAAAVLHQQHPIIPAVAPFAEAIGRQGIAHQHQPIARETLQQHRHRGGHMHTIGDQAEGHIAAAAGFAALEAELGLGAEDAGEVLLRIRDRRANARGLEASWIEERIAARTDARGAKDFAAADAIRDELAAQGVELLDGPQGTGWTIAD